MIILGWSAPSRIGPCATVLVLALRLPSLLCAQQMVYKVSVYNQATLSSDYSTLYGVTTVVDNSIGCGHSQYSTILAAVGPNGPLGNVTASGFVANISVSTGGVTGTYYI